MNAYFYNIMKINILLQNNKMVQVTTIKPIPFRPKRKKAKKTSQDGIDKKKKKKMKRWWLKCYSPAPIS